MSPGTVLPKFKGIGPSGEGILPEVLFHILGHLTDPRDLYQASLVSHSWRQTATDDRLWQPHYWRFYRPFFAPNASSNDTSELLLRQRERVRREAMLAWLQQASTSPPTVELFEYRSKVIGQAKKEWDDLRTKPPPPGVSKDEHEAAIKDAELKLKWLHYDQRAMPTHLDQDLAPPPFLAALASNEAESTADGSSIPNFCRLFAFQMNADEALLLELQRYVDLNANTLHELLGLIAKYGPSARPLWAAICATQRVRYDNTTCFLPSEKQENTSWPCALDVHSLASSNKTRPHLEHCMALCHAAKQALSHLQRQEALATMQALQDRRHSFDCEAFPSLRECVMACCQGLEEANESLALFRSGNALEVREYVDLLALFVSADLQAEDRRATVAKGDTTWGLQADAQKYPADSTRHQMMRILDSVRRLGFVTTSGSDRHDYDNPFLNVVLNCPAQRATLPITQASIVCAVARRLGFAATISKSTLRTFVVAVEDGDQPAAWRPDDESREWHRFFVDVAAHSKGAMYETQDVRRFLSAQSVPRSQQDSLLEPASPVEILAQLASALAASIKAERGSVTRLRGQGRYPAEDGVILDSAEPYQLGRLRLYLEGRQVEPPAPLLPTVLTSSLDPLPPTEKHDPRTNPHRLPNDAKYCALWLSRIVAPQQVGGLERANDLLAEMISNITSMYTCDYVLLMQHDRSPKGKPAVVTIRGASDEPVLERGKRLKVLCRVLCPLIRFDGKLGCGLGCAGGAKAELRQRGSGTALPRRLVDRAYPSNSEIRFGVGTVIRHREYGWKGVIVGWDNECRSCPGFIAEHDIVSV